METFLIDIVMGDLWGLHSAKVMLCPSQPRQTSLNVQATGFLPVLHSYNPLSRIVPMITRCIISSV